MFQLVIEPSSGTAVAAALNSNLGYKKIGVILCGGNVDIEKLPW